jgi:hypothetical protein
MNYRAWILVGFVALLLAFGFKGVGGDTAELDTACKELCSTRGYAEGRANMVGREGSRYNGCACKDKAGKVTVEQEQ